MLFQFVQLLTDFPKFLTQNEQELPLLSLPLSPSRNCGAQAVLWCVEVQFSALAPGIFRVFSPYSPTEDAQAPAGKQGGIKVFSPGAAIS